MDFHELNIFKPITINNTFEAKALEVDTKAPNFNSSLVRFHFKPE